MIWLRGTPDCVRLNTKTHAYKYVEIWSSLTICNNRYALKTNATSAYDDKEKRFVIIPCLTQGCQHHCCYACRYNGADPWDAFNFELDTCAFCNHDQQRNKLSFNKKEKNCWFKQQETSWIEWKKLQTILKHE